MQIEHIAINVADPAAVVRWYVAHLGLRIVREGGNAYFIADDSGRNVLEVYRNPAAGVPDYAAMDPMRFHIAFRSSDLAADYRRLLAAGATAAGAGRAPTEVYGVVTLRDPWGLAIQLARRQQPLGGG